MIYKNEYRNIFICIYIIELMSTPQEKYERYIASVKKAKKKYIENNREQYNAKMKEYYHAKIKDNPEKKEKWRQYYQQKKLKKLEAERQDSIAVI